MAPNGRDVYKLVKDYQRKRHHGIVDARGTAVQGRAKRPCKTEKRPLSLRADSGVLGIDAVIKFIEECFTKGASIRTVTFTYSKRAKRYSHPESCQHKLSFGSGTPKDEIDTQISRSFQVLKAPGVLIRGVDLKYEEAPTPFVIECGENGDVETTSSFVQHSSTKALALLPPGAIGGPETWPPRYQSSGSKISLAREPPSIPTRSTFPVPIFGEPGFGAIPPPATPFSFRPDTRPPPQIRIDAAAHTAAKESCARKLEVLALDDGEYDGLWRNRTTEDQDSEEEFNRQRRRRLRLLLKKSPRDIRREAWEYEASDDEHDGFRPQARFQPDHLPMPRRFETLASSRSPQLMDISPRFWSGSRTNVASTKLKAGHVSEEDVSG
jgi:hypothetical protein